MTCMYMYIHCFTIFIDDFPSSGEMLDPPSSPEQFLDPAELSPEIEMAPSVSSELVMSERTVPTETTESKSYIR